MGCCQTGTVEGSKVSVYMDVEGRCRRGLAKHFEGLRKYVGNGIAEISRKDVFAANGAAMRFSFVHNVH